MDKKILAISLVIISVIVLVKVSYTGRFILDTNLTIPNTPPYITAPNFTIYEGESINLSGYIYDRINEPMNISFSSIFNGSQFWLTNLSDSGTYYVEINASDGEFLVRKTIKIIVKNTDCDFSLKLADDLAGIELEWSRTIGEFDYNNFTIFYSSNMTDGVFDNSSASNYTTNETSWTDNTAGTVTQRYYRLRGFNSTYHKDCMYIDGKYDIPLTTENGRWNFISLPLTPFNKSRDSVLKNVLNDIDWIFQYDPTSGLWDTYSFLAQIGDLDRLYPGKSYMIKALANVSITVTGRYFSTLNEHLYDQNGGSNYVGWVNEFTPLVNATTSVDGDIDWIFHYNSTTGLWDFYFFNYGIGNNLTLSPAESYKLIANRDTTLTYMIGD